MVLAAPQFVCLALARRFAVLALYALYRIVPPLFNWALWQADFRGSTATDCISGGACWVFIKVRLNQFLYGFYPESERWRVWLLFLGITPATFLALWCCEGKKRLWALLFALLVLPVLSWYLLRGGVFGLPEVRPSLWGGMILTLVVASAGLLFSLPFGILLALGRTSDMPFFARRLRRFYRTVARRAAGDGAVYGRTSCCRSSCRRPGTSTT